MEGLRRALADAQREQRELNDQADLTRKRLERAGKLTSGLADEGVRWQATAETISVQLVKLVGGLCCPSILLWLWLCRTRCVAVCRHATPCACCTAPVAPELGAVLLPHACSTRTLQLGVRMLSSLWVRVRPGLRAGVCPHCMRAVHVRTPQVGDVFLASACIAYYGAFTGAYRSELVAGWIAECKARGIPVSEAASLRSTLGNPVEVREWNIWGLPTDDVSVDNGILVTRGKRWPLMIDPQVRQLGGREAVGVGGGEQSTSNGRRWWW